MADRLLSSSVGLAGANGITGKEEVVPSKTAVLERFIPWDGYQRVGLVAPKDFELISVYDKKGITDAERNSLLEAVSQLPKHVALFLIFYYYYLFSFL